MQHGAALGLPATMITFVGTPALDRERAEKVRVGVSCLGQLAKCSIWSWRPGVLCIPESHQISLLGSRARYGDLAKRFGLISVLQAKPEHASVRFPQSCYMPL